MLTSPYFISTLLNWHWNLFLEYRRFWFFFSRAVIRFPSILTLMCSLIMSFDKSVMFVVPPTCNDGVMNENESDVDCGYSCIPTKKCDDGLRCNNGLDCNSNVCTSNICRGELY